MISLKNEGKIPKTYKEKEQFKELIKTGLLKHEGSISKFEENFEEAIKNINNSITSTQVGKKLILQKKKNKQYLELFSFEFMIEKIPFEIGQLFNDEKCLNINSEVCFDAHDGF